MTARSARARGPAGLGGVAVCWLLSLLGGCSPAEIAEKRTWVAMGTQFAITVRSTERDRLDAYVAAAEDEVKDLENRFSVFKRDSEISWLNRSAGFAPIEVSEPVRVLLDLSRRHWELSGGCFDPTVGPLVRLWGFSGGEAPAAVPDPALVARTRAQTGYNRLRLEGNTAFLDGKGMGVDLGGIAKGYAVDRCYEKLLPLKARDLLIDAGGNMRCHGTPRTGDTWRIGVRNPFNRGDLLGTIRLPSGMAVSTSGNYERFVTIGGERYAHILDPATGYPVKGMAGVTVVADTATAADALSTALFVAGMEKGMRILRKAPGDEALFVPDRQPIELWLSPGFGRYFTPAAAAAGRMRVLSNAPERERETPDRQPAASGRDPR